MIRRPTTIRRFQTQSFFDLMDLASLSVDEREAVEAAIQEQRKSTNPKFQAGAAVLSTEGQVVAIHNEKVGPGHHAEQTAISQFYKRVPGGKIRALAVVGARAGDKPIRCDVPYGDDATLDNIDCVWLCGKCLEFAHDCSANRGDVDVLLVTATRQVLKTTLRSLAPRLHTSSVVPIVFSDGRMYPVPSTEEHKDNANGNRC